MGECTNHEDPGWNQEQLLLDTWGRLTMGPIICAKHGVDIAPWWHVWYLTHVLLSLLLRGGKRLLQNPAFYNRVWQFDFYGDLSWGGEPETNIPLLTCFCLPNYSVIPASAFCFLWLSDRQPISKHQRCETEKQVRKSVDHRSYSVTYLWIAVVAGLFIDFEHLFFRLPVTEEE